MSMRSKDDHLAEIDDFHISLGHALQKLRRTRSNVPTGKYLHARLMRLEHAIHDSRREAEFIFKYLDQHGYE